MYVFLILCIQIVSPCWRAGSGAGGGGAVQGGGAERRLEAKYLK